MMYLIYFSMMNSFLFILVKHPLTLGLILMIQTILICLMLGFLMLNFWFSYILFLIMIGGMLVLLIYMTSIASNEKFKYSNKIMFMLLILFMINMFIMPQDLFNSNKMNINLESLNNFNFMNLMLTKLINFPYNTILLMLIIYLLITLIAVVKIANTNKGPLRQNF